MRHVFPAALLAVIVGSGLSSADDSDAIKKEHAKLKGTWQVVALTVDGKDVERENARKLTVVNHGDGSWTVYSDEQQVAEGKGRIDPTKSPKTINFTTTDNDGEVTKYLGIYEVGDDTRRLCFAPAEDGRPSEFSSFPGFGHTLVKLERVKDDSEGANQ